MRRETSAARASHHAKTGRRWSRARWALWLAGLAGLTGLTGQTACDWPLDVRLDLDRTVIHPGDSLEGTLRVENRAAYRVTVKTSSSCDWDLRIRRRDTGELVQLYAPLCVQIVGETRFDPREERVLAAGALYSTECGPAAVGFCQPLTPGRYLVTVSYLAENRPEDTVPIEVIAASATAP